MLLFLLFCQPLASLALVKNGVVLRKLNYGSINLNLSKNQASIKKKRLHFSAWDFVDARRQAGK